MIILDANILIRAVLGKRVRKLLETYAEHDIRFYAPEVAYADAEKYLPALLAKRGKSNDDLPATLVYLQSLIDPIGEEAYGLFEEDARQRLRGRDEEDWPARGKGRHSETCDRNPLCVMQPSSGRKRIDG
jgi:hypothetical protein